MPPSNILKNHVYVAAYIVIVSYSTDEVNLVKSSVFTYAGLERKLILFVRLSTFLLCNVLFMSLFISFVLVIEEHQ